jgi:hypothetical protein
MAKVTILNFDEHTKKLHPSYIEFRSIKSRATMENSLAVSSKADLQLEYYTVVFNS